MPLNNLSRNTQVINDPNEVVEKLKKRVSTLTSKITVLNTNLRVKDEQIMVMSESKHTELNLIKRAIIDKVKAFQRNINSYCEKHNLTEEDLSKLSLFKQPKNYIEKVEYEKILEGMK